MSNPRYDWWGYVKGMIRRYPNRNTAREREAVEKAIERTGEMPDGAARLALVKLVFWRGTHTLSGAAQKCCVSGRTARRWHTEFIRTVAGEFGLME